MSDQAFDDVRRGFRDLTEAPQRATRRNQEDEAGNDKQVIEHHIKVANLSAQIRALTSRLHGIEDARFKLQHLLTTADVELDDGVWFQLGTIEGLTHIGR